jgi:hypothetical protein
MEAQRTRARAFITPTHPIRRNYAPGTKLTNDDAEAIRGAYAARAGSMRALGRQYGVSNPTIHKIVHGHTYKPLAQRLAARREAQHERASA